MPLNTACTSDQIWNRINLWKLLKAIASGYAAQF